MTWQMKRREFLACAGGAAVSAFGVRTVRGQPATGPVVGILGGSQVDARDLREIRRGLGEVDLVEGRNVALEFRSADGNYDRLPALAADLVQRRVGVILAIMATQAAHAAKQATSTTPIVFVNGSDPVQQGLVTSFNRPGGNVTGVTFLTNTLGAKRIEVLHELIPKARTIGFLVNPNNSNAEAETADVQAGARALGLDLVMVKGGSLAEIDAAFATLLQPRVDAILLAGDAYFRTHDTHLIALANNARMPMSFANRDFVDVGGLMSYGTSRADAVRLASIYAGRIIKGEKAADLPVQQSIKVELVINLKTAKMLGIEVPLPMLMRVDEVIE